MNSTILSQIEIVFVGAIIVLQIILALKTCIKINILRSIIPSLSFFKIKKYNIPIEELKAFEPRKILLNISAYEKKPAFNSEPVFSENGEDVASLFSDGLSQQVEFEKEIVVDSNEVSLINPNENSKPIFDAILTSVNVYLLRNKGAVADFNLIKDIVERNIDIEDEDISQTVTVPLYLGLIGTMTGIVFGLATLLIVSDANADFEIKGFLVGVSIAMIASLHGLAWTVYNSSFNFKTARRAVEKSKNDFYTFIQTELLPILNQSVSSSVYTLHTNLIKFNDNFMGNLNKLTGLLNKNHDALIAQERILQALESIDITAFAKANVMVLKELKAGTEHLNKFNQYLNSLNYLVSGTTQLSQSFETLLTKADNFKGLAEKLDSRVEESNRLVQFLNDHYQLISERGEIIRDSVVKFEDIMVKSLGQLEEHTQTKMDAIKHLTTREEDLMIQSFAENRSHFSKLLVQFLNDHYQLISQRGEFIRDSVVKFEDIMVKSLGQLEEHTQTKMDAIKHLTTREEDLMIQSFAENRSHFSKLLVQFLNDHYQLISERGEYIRDSVIKIEDIVVKSLGQLEEHTQTKMDAIKRLTIKEEDLMAQSFAENRSHFSNLSLLADMKKSVEDIKSNSTSQINTIKDEMKSLKESIERTNTVLKEINTSSFAYKIQSIAKSIRQLFPIKK